MSVQTTSNEEVLKVSSGSDAKAVASAIAHGVTEGKDVIVRAIGAGAVNQAVKAIAIARGYVASRAIDLTCKPGFDMAERPEDGRDTTVMVFHMIVTR